MYALSPRALGIHIRQITCVHVTTIKCSSVCKHLETNSILCDAQHGFRKNRSCKTQLITAVHDIATRLSSGDQVGIPFLDFSKAFDKVPHAQLLHKLKYYGIHGAYLEWIKDFLTNRTQQVGIDNKISVPFPVLLVYHRGSVLGPLLCLSFINDLPSNINSVLKPDGVH